MTIADHNQEVSRSALIPYFHELDYTERETLWDGAREHLAAEHVAFAEQPVYGNMRAVERDINKGVLVPVVERSSLYGIANPVRSRYILPSSVGEGSVPYLRSYARDCLDDFASDIHIVSQRETDFWEQLTEEGFSDFRISVYSLLRITPYQKKISLEGRFAVGYDGTDATSTHERALAADVDHSGFYATVAQSGEEITLNREADEENFQKFMRLLPEFKNLLRYVISHYEDDGAIMALEEVPEGWGGWHIAFL